MKQTWIKSITLLVFIQVNGQLKEYGNEIGFQYGVAPSLGKHQLETYHYTFRNRSKIWNVASFFEIEYLNTRFAYFEVPGELNLEEYERLHLVNLKLEGVKAISRQWDVLFQFNPQLSSNFSSGLSFDDSILGFKIGMVKNWKESSFSIGIARNTLFGEPTITPFLSYAKKINEQFHFQLGFPKTLMGFAFDQRHKLTASALLQGNSYNITGSDSFPELGAISRTRLNFTAYNLSLTHAYRIQPHIITVTQLGLLVGNTLEVENTDGDSLYRFNTNQSLYFSMGLQYKLNRN